MVLSAQEMLGTLVGMGLVDPSDVGILSGDSTEVLVDGLVKQGKLTPFQGVAVLAGRTRELVLGRYVLLEEIATGGMGRVYKALHRQMDRVVALKVLAPARTDTPTALATNVDGEWKVGPGMTSDGRGVHVLVRNGLFQISLLASEQVQAAGLREKEMFRSVDDKFRLRLCQLVHLREAHVRVLSGTDGKRQLAIRFHCGASMQQPLEAAALLLEWVAAPDEAVNKKLSTHELYTYLSWSSPQSGWHEVSIDLRPEQRLPEAGGTVRVWLTAFLLQPRPSFYRVSEDCIARLE